MASKQTVGGLLGVVIAVTGAVMYVMPASIVQKLYGGWDDNSRRYVENVKFFGSVALIFGLALLAIVFARWLQRDSDRR